MRLKISWSSDDGSLDGVWEAVTVKVPPSEPLELGALSLCHGEAIAKWSEPDKSKDDSSS